MATRVTVSLLCRYLEQYGWHHYKAVEEPGEREGLIITGWRSSPGAEGYLLTIDPMVEKGCLAFHVPKVLEAPRDKTHRDRLADLLMAIVFINYLIILVKFSYDPRDGEVRFSVTMPIDEGDLTYEQFRHCVRVMTNTVEEYAPKLRAIANGRMRFQQFLEEELGESEAITTLARLLDTLKRLSGR